MSALYSLDNITKDSRLLILILCVVTILILMFTFVLVRNSTLKGIVKSSKEISVKKFLRMRNQKKGRKLSSNKADVPGVYIIHNHSQRMYYVGQAQHVVSRANNHFTGKGNGRIYADYVHGDRFTIRFVRLRGSGEKNLNSLERKYIKKYNALEAGYNRTKGNN